MTSRSAPELMSSAFIAETPAGSLALAVSPKGLARLFFCNKEDYIHFLMDNDLAEDDFESGVLAKAVQQIREYFDGSRKAFDLDLDLSGQSSFRKIVLKECARIPFGRTITYGELAGRSGNPKAARAAGSAMANNPIALVIPCHRVVGSDRGLHGFSSPGGLGTKQILLQHEGIEVKNRKLV